MMLKVANDLTADDLDLLRGMAPECPPGQSRSDRATKITDPEIEEAADQELVAPGQDASSPVEATDRGIGKLSAGDREQLRTRESKVSTACIGQERVKHEWWPIGTELVGHIGPGTFTATVVQNARVKSGRSVEITSGLAAGRICLTPTRAAIEATEDYRQANNLGRGGGVANGWTFWQPRA